MKILCPEHNGLIEVPSKDIADAFNAPVKALVFNCPVCQEEVLVREIQLQEDSSFQQVSAKGKKQG